jgi:hypothetical protein
VPLPCCFSRFTHQREWSVLSSLACGNANLVTSFLVLDSLGRPLTKGIVSTLHSRQTNACNLPIVFGAQILRADDTHPSVGDRCQHPTSRCRRADPPIQAHSASLRKELGSSDLAFASIPSRGHPGFLWNRGQSRPGACGSLVLGYRSVFYSSSVVVTHLKQSMPLEGGLYESARLAVGDGVGFLVAWNLWLYVVLYVASIGNHQFPGLCVRRGCCGRGLQTSGLCKKSRSDVLSLSCSSLVTLTFFQVDARDLNG